MERTVEVSMEHLQNLFGLYDGHIRKIEHDFHMVSSDYLGFRPEFIF